MANFNLNQQMYGHLFVGLAYEHFVKDKIFEYYQILHLSVYFESVSINSITFQYVVASLLNLTMNTENSVSTLLRSRATSKFPNNFAVTPIFFDIKLPVLTRFCLIIEK